MRSASRKYHGDDALAELDAALAAAPDALELQFERACCLEDLGRAQEAATAYGALLQRDPHHLGALTNLGLMLRQNGRGAEGRALLTEAIANHPRSAMGYVNFGQAVLADGEVATAERAFAAALQLEPDFTAALHAFALLYEQTGDEERSADYMRRAFAQQAVWTRPFRGDGTPVRVLLLVSGRGGDIVSESFLDDRLFATSMIVPEGVRDPAALPPSDVVFNGIGDADRCARALAAADALLRDYAVPAINAPAAVARTGRVAVARTLAGIPDLVAPAVTLVARDELEPAALAARGLPFPLILRTPGYHAGTNVERVETPGELAAAAARLPGPDLFAIPFVDTRGPDGAYRKYRMLFVDGRPYPIHVAIGGRWLLHYFSGEAFEREAYRAEEARFLDDPESLGAAATAALAEVARRLALDYCGIDFGFDHRGRVVVFEANAAMAVYLPPRDARWDYRRPAITAAIAAVRSAIAERAAR